MIIDVSSNQGRIDWLKVSKQVDGVILRATIKNGNLDPRFMEYYNGILKNSNSKLQSISAYKFSYERTYIGAYREACECLQTLLDHGVRMQVLDRFYCDIEQWGGRDYTTAEADAVLKGYRDACVEFGVTFGMYFNYNYAKHIVNAKVWRRFPLWIARYNKTLGDVSPWTPELWQYTSAGKIDGISTPVDISKELK